ncbi:hypothetical protein L2750_04745 [Shewanella submarina]|uniref:DUF4083 domain-containing protein n=1 Tax=Shewanella submarina TaxID=2016376 RepID=A0ABV7GMR1_9GAMM|nr:hypothetical protein [Shewanella submarina]MCL1036459.1 hypothetical protein [Shewanella submarina]
MGQIETVGMLIKVVFIIGWLLIPLFVILIYLHVKQMRETAVEMQMEIKELNANIKYLKRRFNEKETEGSS